MTIQNSTEFKNSWVIVTGGDRGIGRAISCQFASYGANVIVIYKKNKSEAKKNYFNFTINGSGSQGNTM